MKTTNYHDDAVSDARDTARNFLDEICEQLTDSGEASDDLFNDYAGGDSYHHENHVDRFYNLSEAAEVLDQLSEFEETDSGLWEGLPPRDAIAAQAAYTYGNAVITFWREIIDDVNSDDGVALALTRIGEIDEDAEDADNQREILARDLRDEVERVIATA